MAKDPTTRVSKIIELKGKTDNATIIVGDFSISQQLKEPEKKASKDDLKNTTNLDLIICRTQHPTTAEQSLHKCTWYTYQDRPSAGPQNKSE